MAREPPSAQRATPWDARTYDRVSEPQLEWAARCWSGCRASPRTPPCSTSDAAPVASPSCSPAWSRRDGCWPSTPPPRWWSWPGSAWARGRRSAAGTCSSCSWTGEVDAIVSTATLHWVPDHERLWPVLARALRDGGRLEAQCGGEGNIARVRETIDERRARARAGARWLFAVALRRRRGDGPDAWQRSGFEQVRCWLEPRPTEPEDPAAFIRTSILAAHLERLAPRATGALRRRGRGERAPAARLRAPEHLREACDPWLMASTFPEIDERLEGWIAAQSMYFVATAPLGADGHVNVSPKGPIETLRVLDPQTVAYLDIVGSGAETIAHIRENGRIVIMLCAFQGPPRILRLHGRGEVVVPGEERFEQLMAGGRLRAAERARLKARDRAGAREPDRRLVRVRGAADELRGQAPAHERVGREEGQGRRPRGAAGLPAREELVQPRRAAGGGPRRGPLARRAGARPRGARWRGPRRRPSRAQRRGIPARAARRDP